MKITCVSDLHGSFPETEGGDLLLIAGDLTTDDKTRSWLQFYTWLGKQNYRKKIYIAGNHDEVLKHCATSSEERELLEILDEYDDTIEYLCDSGTEFEGLKIWGSPWSLWFEGINPHCQAFTGNEELLHAKFSLIPKDTDILITHSPPFGILDRTKWGELVGSGSLRNLLYGESLRPRVHLYGHIHEAYGHIPKMLDFPGVQFINASHMDVNYEPVNPPINIEL